MEGPASLVACWTASRAGGSDLISQQGARGLGSKPPPLALISPPPSLLGRASLQASWPPLGAGLLLPLHSPPSLGPCWPPEVIANWGEKGLDCLRQPERPGGGGRFALQLPPPEMFGDYVSLAGRGRGDSAGGGLPQASRRQGLWTMLPLSVHGVLSSP